MSPPAGIREKREKHWRRKMILTKGEIDKLNDIEAIEKEEPTAADSRAMRILAALEEEHLD